MNDRETGKLTGIDCPGDQATDPTDPLGKRRTVAVDPKRSELVLKGFQLYSTGAYTLSSLTDELNRLGLTSKEGKKRPSGPVSRRCVEEMLKNRFYIGEFWDRKKSIFVKHPYPTFIPLDLFNAVQARLKTNVRRTKGKHDRELGLHFKPFLYCGECGHRYTGTLQKGKFRYYSCAAAHQKKDGKRLCTRSRYYREETIDRLIADAVGRLYVDDVVARRIREHLRSAHDREEAPRRNELRRLQSEETRKTRHLDLLYSDRLDGKLTIDEYARHRSRIQTEIADIRSRLAFLSASNADYQEQGSTILELLKGFRETYLQADGAGKARILNVILDRVVLKGKDTAESRCIFNPPFDLLLEIGEYVRGSEKWGE